MRNLVRMSRRAFGQGLGVSVALTVLSAAAGARSQAASKVTIRRFAFHPQALTIKRGETVEWTNLDTAPHTASGTAADWDTGEIRKREAASVTFRDAGVFEYLCAYHPHMTGRVIVAE